MDVGPHDDISTFLLHIRRAADNAASSLSHDVIVNPADGDKATAASAIDTGNVDTGGKASTPPTDMAIDDTNCPTGTLGIIPTGPSDDTHITNSNINGTLVVNSDIAASPTLEETTMGPNDGTLTVISDIAASPTLEENATSAVGAGSHDDTHIVISGTTASPTLKRKRKYAPARAARRQCKRWEGRRDLDDTARMPDSGGAQAGGDGEGRA